MQVFLTLLNWVQVRRHSDQEKDLHILVLRHQLAIAERKLRQPLRISRPEKLILVLLAARLRAVTGCPVKQLDGVIRLFQPETVFKWHRELVRRKWTYLPKARGGRPRTKPEIERLVVRLARENSEWGNGKIQGELFKLGYLINEETVANILKRYGIPSAPLRKRSVHWRQLMTHYREQILACDFFTVETAFLKTLSVMVFIELGSRRVHFAGCTAHPYQHWVTQRARQLVWELEERDSGVHFLIHDNDVKFTAAFDAVFQSEHITVIHTPLRAPNANAFVERWVRTVREECLDEVLIINQAHLDGVLRVYIDYYNRARPHRGIEQRTPIPQSIAKADGTVQCRNVLGGVVHDYYRDAA